MKLLALFSFAYIVYFGCCHLEILPVHSETDFICGLSNSQAFILAILCDLFWISYMIFVPKKYAH